MRQRTGQITRLSNAGWLLLAGLDADSGVDDDRALGRTITGLQSISEIFRMALDHGGTRSSRCFEAGHVALGAPRKPSRSGNVAERCDHLVSVAIGQPA